jgi:hypothetical protein
MLVLVINEMVFAFLLKFWKVISYFWFTGQSYTHP